MRGFQDTLEDVRPVAVRKLHAIGQPGVEDHTTIGSDSAIQDGSARPTSRPARRTPRNLPGEGLATRQERAGPASLFSISRSSDEAQGTDGFLQALIGRLLLGPVARIKAHGRNQNGRQGEGEDETQENLPQRCSRAVRESSARSGRSGARGSCAMSAHFLDRHGDAHQRFRFVERPFHMGLELARKAFEHRS